MQKYNAIPCCRKQARIRYERCGAAAVRTPDYFLHLCVYSRVIRDILNSEANKLDKQMLEYNLKQIDSLEDLDDAAKEAVCVCVLCRCVNSTVNRIKL